MSNERCPTVDPQIAKLASIAAESAAIREEIAILEARTASINELIARIDNFQARP